MSFTISLTLFAGMQMFKQQLASTEYMTIVGGLIGSLVFFLIFSLVALYYVNKIAQTKYAPVVVSATPAKKKR
ncbi:hypothetical protein KUTeg_018605 [Tegillarca granosa]|uniref:Dolichyl-diphosphooligosaccharide--protein glycosyltransferase subunit KCP2 n=1 Tax=Tegillarca granosa TaxID=220873 RepID=A0ABQ9EN46_TEGGR|nr:hypothetical protein KUTeg_018605 [Tegillarca granosa]